MIKYSGYSKYQTEGKRSYKSDSFHVGLIFNTNNLKLQLYKITKTSHSIFQQQNLILIIDTSQNFNSNPIIKQIVDNWLNSESNYRIIRKDPFDNLDHARLLTKRNVRERFAV